MPLYAFMSLYAATIAALMPESAPIYADRRCVVARRIVKRICGKAAYHYKDDNDRTDEEVLVELALPLLVGKIVDDVEKLNF